MAWRAVLSVVVGTLVAGGCSSSSSGSGSSATGATYVEYCRRVCAKVLSCDQRLDVASCEAECRNNNATQGPKLRGEYLGGLAGCLERADCASLLQSAEETVDGCRAEVTLLLSPTPAGQGFCDRYEQARRNCSRTFDKVACLLMARLFSDATFASASPCLSRACDGIDACVDAQFAECLSCSL